MKTNTKVILSFGGAVLLGGVLGFRGTKRTVLKRCRSRVKGECRKVPLIGTEEFCDEIASDICKA